MKKAKGADSGNGEFEEEWTEDVGEKIGDGEERHENKEGSNNANEVNENGKYCSSGQVINI